MTVLLMTLGLLVQQGTVFGWVRAEGSREPIPFASVEVGSRTVFTDEHGYYVVPGVAAGPVRVRASMIGYRATESNVVVPAGGAVRADLLLPTAAVRLEEIRVGGGAGEVGAPAAAGPQPIRLDAAMLEYVPALAEKDVLRAIQVMPSVAAASDFSSALYIRGGSPDQSVVLVDGAPVFNPYHLGGIFSAIDPDAIASMELLPGGMSAGEADRISGVVKVWTRDGGRDRVRGHGAVGLVSSRLGFDGPLPTEGGTFLLSGRRTYFDLMTKAAYELGLIATPFPYSFTDAHLKLTQDIGAMGRLSVSGYINDERIHTPREIEPDSRTAWAWGTRAGSATYRQPLGASLMASINFAATSFDGDFDVIEMEAGLPDTLFLGRINMTDVVLGTSFTRYGAGHQLRGGAQLDSYGFRYDFFLGGGRSRAGDPTGDDLGGADLFSAIERDERLTTVAAFLENEWLLPAGLRLRAGVRALTAAGAGTALMPRLGARLPLNDRVALTAAAGRYAQAIHSLRDEESVLASVMPYELLVPADAAVGFNTADDLVLGVEYATPHTRLRVEGYTKRYATLAIPPLAPDPLTAPVFAREFRSGTGAATGLELMGQHSRGGSTLLASYALTWGSRELDGVRYTPRFHRRHLADVTAAWSVFGGSLVTGRLAAGSGQPFTPALSRIGPYRYDPAEGVYRPIDYGAGLVLGEHNSERLPAYYRLDLGYRGHMQRRMFRRDVTLEPYIQVLNVLGNRNVVTGAPQYDEFEGRGRIDYFPALPTLPTVGVEWRF
jgi:hypothetical protein